MLALAPPTDVLASALTIARLTRHIVVEADRLLLAGHTEARQVLRALWKELPAASFGGLLGAFALRAGASSCSLRGSPTSSSPLPIPPAARAIT